MLREKIGDLEIRLGNSPKVKVMVARWKNTNIQDKL
jgi:hypothetical protein